jgi:hypothetical protein
MGVGLRQGGKVRLARDSADRAEDAAFRTGPCNTLGYGRSKEARTMVETPTTIEFTTEEIREQLDREADARCGMSGTDLLAAYNDGRLEDPGAVADLLALADLLGDDVPA